MPAKQVYIALGSNLGDKKQNLQRALVRMEDEEVHVVKYSSIYETEPQDVRDQPWFLNMVAECESRYFPLQLLAVLQRVERQMGRVRAGVAPRGPRSIDLDILMFGGTKMKTPKLELPHPRMLGRRFVLEPLLEIAPRLRYPATDVNLAAALQEVKDQVVRKVGQL
jgi:2-amino-4-hydroxy-6-hydroxymethyldihydropteridine diphosphokinase